MLRMQAEGNYPEYCTYYVQSKQNGDDIPCLAKADIYLRRKEVQEIQWDGSIDCTGYSGPRDPRRLRSANSSYSALVPGFLSSPPFPNSGLPLCRGWS